MRDQLEFMRGELFREREEKNYYKNLLMQRMGMGTPPTQGPKKTPIPIQRREGMLDARVRLEMEHAKRAREQDKSEEKK